MVLVYASARNIVNIISIIFFSMHLQISTYFQHYFQILPLSQFGYLLLTLKSHTFYIVIHIRQHVSTAKHDYIFSNLIPTTTTTLRIFNTVFSFRCSDCNGFGFKPTISNTVFSNCRSGSGGSDQQSRAHAQYLLRMNTPCILAFLSISISLSFAFPI